MPKYNVRAPALPLPTPDYLQAQQDQFQNALRLYFNRLDDYNIAASIPASGTTAERPAIALLIGQFYFDTTLGIPIWYNGTVWKNASGTTV
jgi:hypothetical protein